MAGYFRLIPALRHPSFTQRKNSVFLCTRICGAGTKFALEAICLMKVRYFLVAIAVCLMLSVCSGCYGTGYDRSIPTMAYPSGNVLEISTGAELNPGTYIAYGANQFSTDLSLSALVQRIYRDDAVFQIVSMPAQKNISTLIWVPQGNGTRDVYYPEKVGQDGEKNWYLFSGLCYRLYNDQEGTDSILFPGFCLDAPDDDILKLSYRAIRSAGHTILPKEDTDFESAAYRKTCLRFFKLMCATSLGKICASDHAMNAVDEMSALDRDLKRFFEEVGADDPVWQALERESGKYLR